MPLLPKCEGRSDDQFEPSLRPAQAKEGLLYHADPCASWLVKRTKNDLPRQYLDSKTMSAHRPTCASTPPILPCDLIASRRDVMLEGVLTARATMALISQNAVGNRSTSFCMLRSVEKQWHRSCLGCLELGFGIMAFMAFMAWQSLLRAYWLMNMLLSKMTTAMQTGQRNPRIQPKKNNMRMMEMFINLETVKLTAVTLSWPLSNLQ